MKTATETSKPRGRTPAKLNIVQAPDVGCAYIGATKDAKNHLILVRIGTTCARDTNASKEGELIGAQLTNYSGVVGKGMGEKYFTAKLGRKGAFTYLVFLCSEHHKKCMGAEVKAKDLLKTSIDSTIAHLMKGAEADGAKADKEGRICISGFQGDFKFEWTDKTYKTALAEGASVFEFKNGAYVQIGEKPAKAVKAPKAPKEKAKPAKAPKKEKAKPAKTPKKEKAPAKKPAKAPAKAPAKKPAKVAAKDQTKDPRGTFFGITDGKAVTKRSVAKPEGFFDTKEERDAAMKAAPAVEASSAAASAPAAE